MAECGREQLYCDDAEVVESGETVRGTNELWGRGHLVRVSTINGAASLMPPGDASFLFNKLWLVGWFCP
jgi:hypothetical protein